MLKETTTTFNGSHTSDSTGTTTISYPDIYNEVYDEECPKCDGVGHIHCKDCGVEKRCPRCGGSGKKNVYSGSIYKIYWNVPVTPKPWEPNTTC